MASTSGLFGHVPLMAHGHTVSETELVVLSQAGFERLIQEEPFRRFV